MPFQGKSLKVPWALLFAVKILASVAVTDVVVFPILRVLRVPLPQGYIPITCFEGGFITFIGVLLLLNSLSSKVAVANDRYVGFGTIRRGVRFVELKSEQKHIMRKRGTLMVIIGMLLFIPTLIVIINA